MSKPPLILDGMYGIGDNVHQRALLRELMKTHDVWLKSCHFSLYHDLVEQGLKVLFKGTRLRAQARTINQEYHHFHKVLPPRNATHYKVWYNKPDIDKHGSILESMLGELGYRILNPDFSLPIKPEWYQEADALITKMAPTKPLMILRQLVLRREWDGSKRNPQPWAYSKIYDAVRPHYFVLSIADLAPGQEWIEGPTLRTDAAIHDGSLTFGTMAALYSRASLVMSPAGHGPVLAQATGTPVIVVYGGRESYRTTDRAGAHLAPTLGIDPDHPCDCHTNAHNCNKKITIEPALERTREFLMRLNPPRLGPKTLIYATTYVDCPDRQKLTKQWLDLTAALNPEADLLLVDSKSPLPVLPPEELATFETHTTGRPAKRATHCFPDNVGHLSRGGRDGWGRAFCFGLDAAIDGGYEYVVHIEGDLLFRLPTQPIVQEMKETRTLAMSTPVKGMKRDFLGWCETALMFFQTEFLVQSNFTEKYDWPRRRVAPTPEVVVRELLGGRLRMMPWKVLRGDKNQITRDNVLGLDPDGITHCHNDVWCYDRFMEAAMQRNTSQLRTVLPFPTETKKVNLGCGTNRLAGWENHDADVDIRKPLPWPNDSTDLIFIEHCMEHVTYHQAVRFLEEANRTLKPGGALRVTVPSIEKIAQQAEQDYYQFTSQWGGEATKKGALRAIIFSHGHEQAWTASLMKTTLEYAGFTDLTEHEPGQSQNPQLRGLEGHHRVIGEKFNRIESMCFEARKPGRAAAHSRPRRTAIVLAGAQFFKQELEKALLLCQEAGTKPTVFAVNDQMGTYPGEATGATLHAPKLTAWLAEREKNGYPKLTQIWSHRKDHPEVTHQTGDWAGSSGLFAAKVALEQGFERVLLCGTPMRKQDGHYQRRVPWEACDTFRRGWEFHHQELFGRVKSFSGWTAERLGTPTKEDLLGPAETPEQKRA